MQNKTIYHIILKDLYNTWLKFKNYYIEFCYELKHICAKHYDEIYFTITAVIFAVLLTFSPFILLVKY